MSLDTLGRTDLLGQRDRRPSGALAASVADNRDPTKRGRLKLVVPELSGDTSPNPTWAEPALGFGKSDGAAWCTTFFGLPEIGDKVWALPLHAEPGALEDHMIWLPGWAIDGAVPALLLEHYPKRRGLVTPSGHSFYFDDTAGADGDVRLAQRDGAQLKLAGGGNVALDSKSGGVVKLQGGGRRASGKGHAVNCGSLKVTVVANGAITILRTLHDGTPDPHGPYTLGVDIPITGVIDEGEDGVEIPGP